MNLTQSDYFQIAVTNARAEGKRIVRDVQPACCVGLTITGPSGDRVPCGEATFPRAHADVFTAGVLTVTSRDDEAILRTYQPGEWWEAIVYGFDDQIDYRLTPESRR